MFESMKKRIVMRWTASDLVAFLFWLFFFTPVCIARLSSALGVIAEQLSLSLCGLYIVMNYRKRFHMNAFGVALYVLLVWCFFCVARASIGALPGYIRTQVLPVIEVLFMVDIAVRKRGFNGLKSLYYVSCIYLVLNFLTMVLFPSGMFRSDIGSSVARAQWLFGSKNNIPIYIVIFTTVVVGFRTMNQSGKRRSGNYTVILVAMAIFSVFFSGEDGVELFEGSSTGMVAMVVCTAAFVYLWKLKKMPRLLTVKNTIIGAAVINIIILSGVMPALLSMIVEQVLHKHSTFSGRTAIWQVNLIQIISSPIFGHGMNRFDAPVVLAGMKTFTNYTYNMFLNYMVSYGIVSILLIIIVLLCIRKENTTQIQMINVGFIGILIIGTMNEVSLMNLLFFPIIMSALQSKVPVPKGKKMKLKIRWKRRSPCQ